MTNRNCVEYRTENIKEYKNTREGLVQSMVIVK